MVRSASADDHIAGVSVSVVQNGRVLLLRGYGLASAKPNRPVDPSRTLFRVGSLSKTVTWILLMQLVEQGKVRLDAPINTYLPHDLRVPDQGFMRPIRVIDLMSHAGGFADTSLGHLFADTPATLQPPLSYLARHRPVRVREPGEVSTYSNYGAALAGAIVATQYRQDYATVVEQRLFGPLGMTRSSFREPYAERVGLPSPLDPALARDLAQGLAWSGGRFKPTPVDYITNVAPAGALSTTAADMARYMRLLLGEGVVDGVRLYGPATAKAFRTPILKAPPGTNGWAHGFMEVPLPGGFHGYGHTGSTQFFRSNMVIVPSLGLGVFVTTNSPTARSFVERLPAAIVDRYFAHAAVMQRPGDPRLKAQAAHYAGDYLSTRRAYRGLELFVTLASPPDQVSVTGDGYLIASPGGTPSAWVPEGAPGHFRAATGAGELTFALDPEGRATSFMMTNGTARLERIPALLRPSTMLCAVLAALGSAIAVVISQIRRWRSKIARSRRTRLIDRLTLLTAAMWIAAGATTWWWLGGLDPVDALYHFPGGLGLAASTLAIAATALSILLAAALPFAWFDRADWPRLRALGQSVAVATLIGIAGLLGQWGLLSPWS